MAPLGDASASPFFMQQSGGLAARFRCGYDAPGAAISIEETSDARDDFAVDHFDRDIFICRGERFCKWAFDAAGGGDLQGQEGDAEAGSEHGWNARSARAVRSEAKDQGIRRRVDGSVGGGAWCDGA